LSNGKDIDGRSLLGQHEQPAAGHAQGRRGVTPCLGMRESDIGALTPFGRRNTIGRFLSQRCAQR
jgi:hypothetical protein